MIREEPTRCTWHRDHIIINKNDDEKISIFPNRVFVSLKLFKTALLKGVWYEIFAFRFFHKSVSLGLLSIPLKPFQIFSKIREDICEWMFISCVNDTGEKEKNFEIKFFEIFCEELSLVHFTPKWPKDWSFAYLSFLGVGKLILTWLSNRRFRWHRRKIYQRCRWHRWTIFRLCRWHRR